MDRSKWGNGEWDKEPDLNVWTDPVTGLLCMIRRNHMGSLCGYVGLNKDHPWFDLGYSHQFSDNDYMDSRIDIHGGVTYAGVWDDNKDIWWIGFDCAHAGDLVPFIAAFRKNPPAQEYLFVPVPSEFEDKYRNFDYVVTQVDKLATQLHENRTANP